MILQTLHVASSSNEDESSDMESFVFAICFRDLKCAFKLKPYLVSKLHTSQLYLPTALLSTSRWVPDSLLCCSLLCRSNLKKYLRGQCKIQINSNIFSMITRFHHLLLNQAKKPTTSKTLCLPWLVVGPKLWTIRTGKDLIVNPFIRTQIFLFNPDSFWSWNKGYNDFVEIKLKLCKDDLISEDILTMVLSSKNW